MAPLARTEQNIPGENRLFRKLPTDADWTQVNIGDALEPTGYGTGGAVADLDGDGRLELLVRAIRPAMYHTRALATRPQRSPR